MLPICCRFYFQPFALFTSCRWHSLATVGGSIIPLWTLLLIFNWFILSIKIDDTNLSFCCRFHFHLFTFFIPCRLHSWTTGGGICCPSFWTLLLVFHWFNISIKINDTNLSFCCRNSNQKILLILFPLTQIN